MNRPLFYYINAFLLRCYCCLRFTYRYIRDRHKYGKCQFVFRNHIDETVRVFVTGPSFNEEIAELIKRKEDLHNSIVVNFFVDTELFNIIKPRYYCLADPTFFTKSYLETFKSRILDNLNGVDWDLYFIVPNYGAGFVKQHITNSKIHILSVPALLFEGFEANRNKYYKKGYAAPSFVNVSILAIYSLLNLGYSRIELYGVDHNYFLEGLSVGDNNELYLLRKHFYGENKIVLERYNSDGKKWKISDLLKENYLSFKEHEVLRAYADFLGSEIINCTRNSLIDAYTRRAQIEKKNFENNE